MSNNEYEHQNYWRMNQELKEILVNKDNTYTIISRQGWTLTGNLRDVEKVMNECFNGSVVNLIKEYYAG